MLKSAHINKGDFGMKDRETLGRAQLRRYLGFIERACAQFDDGIEDAALHVALSCRVLFHNTKKQTGLLSQVGWDVEMLSTAVTVNDFQSRLSSYEFTGNPDKPARQAPFLDGMPALHRTLPWKLWWAEAVYPTELGALTREDLVTVAADKELAHPDPTLPPLYARLKAGTWQYQDSRGRTTKVVEMQLADLRQIGFEVLHSPALLNCCRS